jgi:hypothetical protein
MATITSEQLKKYRFVWSRVRKALVEFGDFSPSDAEAERKVIQREAIRSDKSSKDFTNEDLNKVLDSFGDILVIFDGPSNAPTRNAANLIWSIEQLELPESTIAHIAQDAYGRTSDWTGDWRKLSERRLTCLRYTCSRQARALRKRGSASPSQT